MPDDKGIAEKESFCECCLLWKTVRLYILQDGRAAWVCEECREGKRNGG